jgi:ubiquinone/menaquinone biosynthesis C-methylase UbiE
MKLYKIAWSLRRLYVPVNPTSLVLEVGSGGNPYFRSNILLDPYLVSGERHWAPLITDRPFVLGFVEKLPFKDKQFDFVIASHVLEHSSDPSKFLMELERVSKAGYIEVPDAFMERINPYFDHRSEITLRNGKLIIKKKDRWEIDPDLVELYSHRVKNILTAKTMKNHPFQFHVRYYWNEKINFEILNPEVNSNWNKNDVLPFNVQLNFKEFLYKYILIIIRFLFSQKKRNNNISIFNLIVCPTCHNKLEGTEKLYCSKCNCNYEILNGIPNFTLI